MATYDYHIDLDERGEFAATVYDSKGRQVYCVSSDDDGLTQEIEDGWMRHKRDTRGLAQYLAHLGIIGDSDRIEHHSDFI